MYHQIVCMYTASKLELLDSKLPPSCRILPAAFAVINLEVTTMTGDFLRKVGISFSHFREKIKNYRTSQGGST